VPLPPLSTLFPYTTLFRSYVVRLEQGRATAPSEQVVEALARALRLSSAEREHLFVLSGLQPPGPDRVPTHLTPSVQRLVDRLHRSEEHTSELQSRENLVCR